MKDKNNFFMGIAIEISKASYCKRAKVGAILVKDDNIISFGYNGTPAGFENICECENEDITIKEVLHAESNAITKCSKSCYSSLNSTLYITLSPCFECSKLIIQAGIKEVYYRNEYRIKDGLIFLEKCGIRIEKIN
jgi:dCMP deaminase